MNTKLAFEVLKKIDPGQIERRFPNKADKEKFERAKKLFLQATDGIRPEDLSGDNLACIEDACEILQDLYSRLSPQTELASKARMNEAVFWAQTLHVERAIYLAGRAKEIGLLEPYRSQLAIQPANACLQRLVQITRVLQQLQANPPKDGDALDLLRGMERSYRRQLYYFATDAWKQSGNEVFTIYHRVVALLLNAAALSDANEQLPTLRQAEALAQALQGPSAKCHRLELRMFIRLAEEIDEIYSMFPHAVQTANIRGIFANFASEARRLYAEGSYQEPKDHFSYGHMVAVGSRAASIVGFLCMVASILADTPPEPAAKATEVAKPSIMQALQSDVNQLHRQAEEVIFCGNGTSVVIPGDVRRDPGDVALAGPNHGQVIGPDPGDLGIKGGVAMTRDPGDLGIKGGIPGHDPLATIANRIDYHMIA